MCWSLENTLSTMSVEWCRCALFSFKGAHCVYTPRPWFGQKRESGEHHGAQSLADTPHVHLCAQALVSTWLKHSGEEAGKLGKESWISWTRGVATAKPVRHNPLHRTAQVTDLYNNNPSDTSFHSWVTFTNGLWGKTAKYADVCMVHCRTVWSIWHRPSTASPFLFTFLNPTERLISSRRQSLYGCHPYDQISLLDFMDAECQGLWGSAEESPRVDQTCSEIPFMLTRICGQMQRTGLNLVHTTKFSNLHYTVTDIAYFWKCFCLFFQRRKNDRK